MMVHLWDIGTSLLWNDFSSRRYESWETYLQEKPWERTGVYLMPILTFDWQTPEKYKEFIEYDENDEELVEMYGDEDFIKRDVLTLVYLNSNATDKCSYHSIYVTKEDEQSVIEFISSRLPTGFKLSLSQD